MMVAFERVAPVLPVRDVAEALRRYGQLQRENGVFASLNVRVSLRGAKPSRPPDPRWIVAGALPARDTSAVCGSAAKTCPECREHYDKLELLVWAARIARIRPQGLSTRPTNRTLPVGMSRMTKTNGRSTVMVAEFWSTERLRPMTAVAAAAWVPFSSTLT
jgi:hypothetical protein